MRPLAAEDRQWLKDLDQKLWRRGVDDSVRPRAPYAFSNREMTYSEMRRVFRLIRHHQLPCVLFSGPYGELGLGVYPHVETPGVKPEYLVVLGDEQIPDRPVKLGPTMHQHGLQLFSKFTHTPRNRELAKFYGLEEPRELSYYCY